MLKVLPGRVKRGTSCEARRIDDSDKTFHCTCVYSSAGTEVVSGTVSLIGLGSGNCRGTVQAARIKDRMSIKRSLVRTRLRCRKLKSACNSHFPNTQNWRHYPMLHLLSPFAQTSYLSSLQWPIKIPPQPDPRHQHVCGIPTCCGSASAGASSRPKTSLLSNDPIFLVQSVLQRVCCLCDVRLDSAKAAGSCV